MRWACVCSGDTKLTAIFNSGVDVHGAIACEVFGLDCAPNEVKYKYPELRDIAKTIQFLTLYGGGADTLASKVKIKPKRAKAILEQVMREAGLAVLAGTVVNAKGESEDSFEYDFDLIEGNPLAAERLADLFKFPLWKAEAVLGARNRPSALMSAFEIDRDEAQKILDSYFEKYAGVAQYISDTERFTRANGYSLSLLGRKRRVPQVNSVDEGVAERGIRQAVNATIQSIASDGLMLSACALQDEVLDLDDSNIIMMGPIHDALYFEVKEEFAKDAHDLIIKYMSTFPIPSPIPMLADAEWGRDWAHFSETFEDLYQELRDEEDDEEEEELEAA
jgi:DNA polymerase I-like protein with 3'-5' exonuclease and polymerase domains